MLLFLILLDRLPEFFFSAGLVAAVILGPQKSSSGAPKEPVKNGRIRQRYFQER